MNTTSKHTKRRPEIPVRLVVGNCDSADMRNVEHSKKILYNLANEADILLLDECFNMDVEEEIGAKFHVAQRGNTGSSEATNVVAVRKTRGSLSDIESVFGAPETKGTGVRARYWLKTKIQIDDMKPRKFSAGHAQPKRAWSMWNRYMLKAPGGTLGLDTNKLRRAVKVRFPIRKVRQIGLLAAIVPVLIPCTRAKAIETGGDHKAVAVTLWPNKK